MSAVAKSIDEVGKAPQVIHAGGTAPQAVQTAAGETVTVLPLGSGGEVGRSCVVVSFKGKNIMFDCGVHPAKSGYDSLPMFDSFDLTLVDVLLITHFHVDHCAALPYLLTQTKFNGKVYMTSATKAFYKHVMADFLRTSSGGASEIVNAEWIQASMDRIETIEYHQEKSWAGMRFSPYNAGHVLGAAMFLVDIAGVKVFYTGDFSTVEDRHLMGAETPPVSPDIVIVESTYGRQEHDTREVREAEFLKLVTDVVKRDGRCLIPVFALGRAQELLLILEEHWQKNKELQHVKIYYASNLAQRCMKLYQTYVHSMNKRVKEQQELTSTNPFDFRFIFPLQSLRDFDDSGPSVVIAAPGMLQNGISLDLFIRWAPDPRNGIIFAGYCVDGTLAKEVQGKPTEFTAPDGRLLKLRMQTNKAVSFSAHSDARQTHNFLASLRDVTSVVLVHGNPDAQEKLEGYLQQKFQGIREMKIYKTKTPVPVQITFSAQRTAKVLGHLATATTRPTTDSIDSGAAGREIPEGQTVCGILLVSRDNQHIIIHPDDVSTFTGLQCAALTQALVLPLPLYRSSQNVLTTLRNYFAGSETYASLDAVQVAGDGGAALAGLAGATAEDEEILLVGHGISDMVRGGEGRRGGPGPLSAYVDSSAATETPRGILVKVRTDASTGHSVLTLVWKASRLTDLIADLTCIILCSLASTQDERTAADLAAAKNGLTELNPLPVSLLPPGAGPTSSDGGTTGSIEYLYQLKCFHQMMSQFFPSVSTNLATGECRIVNNNGERLAIKKCIEIYADTDDESILGLTNEEYINGVSRQSFDEVAAVLRRIFLTLFPIPADFGWCDCGEVHGEAHVALGAGVGAE
jgi:cleavage and polyadenylation specificity factor subunit 3